MAVVTWAATEVQRAERGRQARHRARVLRRRRRRRDAADQERDARRGQRDTPPRDLHHSSSRHDDGGGRGVSQVEGEADGVPRATYQASAYFEYADAHGDAHGDAHADAHGAYGAHGGAALSEGYSDEAEDDELAGAQQHFSMDLYDQLNLDGFGGGARFGGRGMDGGSEEARQAEHGREDGSGSGGGGRPGDGDVATEGHGAGAGAGGAGGGCVGGGGGRDDGEGEATSSGSDTGFPAVEQPEGGGHDDGHEAESSDVTAERELQRVAAEAEALARAEAAAR